MRLRQALVANRTAAFDRLLRQLGSRQVWHTAAALGLPKLEASADPDNLLHQGGPVTPLELAHAYSLFPNLGMRAGRTETGADLLQPVLVLALRGRTASLYQAYTSDPGAVSPRWLTGPRHAGPEHAPRRTCAWTARPG